MAGLVDIPAVGSDNRMEIVKAFDETKAGVKGLMDSGLQKIPDIFVRPAEELARELTYKKSQIQIPAVDLSGIFQGAERRKQTVEQLRTASETWGFFQVLNHGIPLTVLDGMIDGIINFNDMDVEEKMKYYSRDNTKRVKYMSSYDLFTSKTASWRDTLTISFSDKIYPEEVPASCRDTTVAYLEHVAVLGDTLLELLSEALGLQPDHLYKMDCSKGNRVSSHYYPACPQPELTIGAQKHTDPGFLTVLLTNHISGLQVMYQDQWVDVEPIHGGLVVNIGDLLQLVSNGIFKSSIHRVVANIKGPRISVACFFAGPMTEVKNYGPIKELISEENPAKYREVVLSEYISKFLNTGLDQFLGLDYYKL